MNLCLLLNVFDLCLAPHPTTTTNPPSFPFPLPPAHPYMWCINWCYPGDKLEDLFQMKLFTGQKGNQPELNAIPRQTPKALIHMTLSNDAEAMTSVGMPFSTPYSFCWRSSNEGITTARDTAAWTNLKTAMMYIHVSRCMYMYAKQSHYTICTEGAGIVQEGHKWILIAKIRYPI